MNRQGLRAGWDAFWYAPGSATNLGAARVLIAATALWVVLSRWDLPSILTFPPELWMNVTGERRLRFLMVFGVGTERVLYVLLHLALVSATVGLFPRVSCFVSGLLLYHFGPFETIIRTANPYLRGLTIPTLGLLVLSFSRCGDALTVRGPRGAARPDSWEYRWPLRLVQVLFCQIYLFAGYSKLFTSGWDWTQAGNIRGHLLVLNQALVASPTTSWGYALAQSPLACAAVAWAGIALELLFPLVLVSGAARRVLLPTALVFHLGNSVLFRIFFQNVPLLLLFVDWEAWRARERAAPAATEAPPSPAPERLAS